MHQTKRIVAVFGLLLAIGQFCLGSDWSRGFANPGPEYATGTYWWWFGPAQTREEITRELGVMKEAGIGRILIYPIYPIAADDPANGIKHSKFLSPEFIETLSYAVEKAHGLGMAVSVPMGSGWPYGGPNVSAGQAAQRLRMVTGNARTDGRLDAPALKPGEILVCRLLAPGDGSTVDLTAVKDVTNASEMPAGLAGPYVLLSFVQSPTGMKVKRPALGDEGYVLDHLSREALDSYLNDVGTKLLPGLAGKAIIHADSFEVYAQSWTTNFLDEFKKRRGYDLRSYLPALFVECGAKTADIRHDYWRTIGDLFLDSHMRPLSDWVHRHGSTLQAESYGAPAVDMRGFQWIDHPMGESYDWKNFVASRWASSAAHQTGRRFTATEAWTWLRQPRYLASLEDLKRGADLHFMCGINRIVGHGYAYSPPSAGIPGWGYYASVMLNDTNPWWPYFRLLSDYVRRSSYALSLGKPRADIALYLPEDDALAAQKLDSGTNLYASTMNLYFSVKGLLMRGPRWGGPEFGIDNAAKLESEVITSIMSSGFTFDGIDRSILRPELRVTGGRLEIGDASYRIVVLPNLAGIDPEMLERIADFCHSGGTVVATIRLPDRAYGVVDHERKQARVQDLIQSMFGSGNANQPRRKTYGRGLAIFVPDETEEFKKILAGLSPQAQMKGPHETIYFVQRGEPGHEGYFLANTSDAEREVEIIFRDGKGRASEWNPMTGAVKDLRPVDEGKFRLRFEPFGSTFISFDSGQAALRPQQANTERVKEEAYPVAGPWRLTINGQQMQLDQLKSWTEFPAFKYYSGAGLYETEFTISDVSPHATLDLGAVREIAEVWINGSHAGVSWKQPRRLDVSGMLRRGKNSISIRVTNLLINRVLGQPDPDYSGLSDIRFPLPGEKKAIKEPLPSGLFGPVRILYSKESRTRQ